MKSKAPVRDHDEVKIPNGRYFEPYTPIAGQIISPVLGKKLAWAKMHLSVASTVTFKDGAGNQVTLFPLQAGKQDFLVTEITAVTAGVVAIVHDGELELTQDLA